MADSLLARARAAWVRQLAKSHTPRERMAIAGAPAFLALIVFGMAHGRWVLSGALILLLIAAVVLRWTMERRPWHVLATAIVGAILGGVSLLGGLPPVNALPPAFIEPACGALACLSVLSFVTTRYDFSWIFSWLLVAMCIHIAPNFSLAVPGLLLIAVTMVCALGLINDGRTTPANVLWWGATFAVGLAFAGLLALAALGSERMLTDAGARYLNALNNPSGIGLDSTVDLGINSSIKQTDRLVLDLSGRAPSYLRTHVMDDFDGFRWTTRITDERTTAAPPPDPAAHNGPLTMLFVEQLDSVIPAPAGTISVSGAPARQTATHVWRSGKTPIGPIIEMQRDMGDQLPVEVAQPTAADTALPVVGDLGGLRERFRPIALEIVEGETDPMTQARLIQDYFHANFYYSLHSDLRGKGYPLETMIRERRPTYCIYFASAMAILLRSLDIPARVATGFLPFAVNPVDHHMLVSTLDAHAWVEAYIPERGRYVRFDPTPSRTLDPTVARSPMGWIRGLGAALASKARSAWLPFKADPIGALASLARSPYVSVPVMLLLLWMLWTRRGGGTGRARKALATNDRRLRDLYRRYLKSLGRAGIEADAAESDDELIARLQTVKGSQVADAARRFIAAYRRARYGGEPNAELAKLLEQVTAG